MAEDVDRVGALVRQLQGMVGPRERGVADTPGSGALSFTVTVPHTLGVVPKTVQLTANNGSLLAGYTNLTDTTFDIVVTAPGLGAWGPGAFEVSWEIAA